MKNSMQTNEKLLIFRPNKYMVRHVLGIPKNNKTKQNNFLECKQEREMNPTFLLPPNGPTSQICLNLLRVKMTCSFRTRSRTPVRVAQFSRRSHSRRVSTSVASTPFPASFTFPTGPSTWLPFTGSGPFGLSMPSFSATVTHPAPIMFSAPFAFENASHRRLNHGMNVTTVPPFHLDQMSTLPVQVFRCWAKSRISITNDPDSKRRMVYDV